MNFFTITAESPFNLAPVVTVRVTGHGVKSKETGTGKETMVQKEAGTSEETVLQKDAVTKENSSEPPLLESFDSSKDSSDTISDSGTCMCMKIAHI